MSPGMSHITIAEAVKIVLDLARQNALDPERCDPELKSEACRQQDAIKLLDWLNHPMDEIPEVDDMSGSDEAFEKWHRDPGCREEEES